MTDFVLFRSGTEVLWYFVQKDVTSSGTREIWNILMRIRTSVSPGGAKHFGAGVIFRRIGMEELCISELVMLRRSSAEAICGDKLVTSRNTDTELVWVPVGQIV